MRERLVPWLWCPECHGEFSLEGLVGDPRETDAWREALLHCGGCGRLYPVIGGIPRLLPDALAHMVWRYHRDFFERYAQRCASYQARCRPPRDRWWQAEARTIASYSYQWRKFKQMFPEWEAVCRDSIRPLTPDFFRGRRGVDAGCGFGRSLYYAASWGAEVIGVDLSEAVEAAYENTAHLAGAHIVQGDIFHLPVREGTMDFAYSIGVVHHLPDPGAGVRCISRLAKPGGAIFVWVYARGRGRQIPVLNAVRAVSTRLPLRWLDRLCWVGAALQWLVWIVPYRLLSRWRFLRGVTRHLPFTHYARYPFRVLHTDWVDGFSVPLQQYHRPDEVAAWFHAAGLRDVRIDSDWGGRALGYQPEAAPAEAPIEVPRS